jgi:hypothetical protein
LRHLPQRELLALARRAAASRLQPLGHLEQRLAHFAALAAQRGQSALRARALHIRAFELVLGFVARVCRRRRRRRRSRSLDRC